MKLDVTKLPIHTNRMIIREIHKNDESLFLEAMHESKNFLEPWVRPVQTRDEFKKYLSIFNRLNAWGFLLLDKTQTQIVGFISLGGIIRGCMLSGHLGFYLNQKYAARGLMQEGLEAVILFIFSHIRLHRLEANIQPENYRSKALVQRLGFEKEGYSKDFMYICGAWRDHERWAIRNENL